MPLKRGPPTKLLNFEPAFQIRNCFMAGQIDLQRGDGGIPLGNRVKVRAWARILTRPGISHPVHGTAARIIHFHDGLAAMPVTQARHFDTAQLAIGEIGNVDVENERPRFRTFQSFSHHALHELGGHGGGAGEVARAVWGQT